MGKLIFMFFVYTLTVVLLIMIGRHLRSRYAIITYGLVMRCITVLIFIPANFMTALIIYKALISEWMVFGDGRYVIILSQIGYLRIIYFIALSVFVFSSLLLLEREISSIVVNFIWRYSYHDDIVKNILLLEQKKNEYPHDSEMYAEIICKLADLYTTFIIRAQNEGRYDLVEEYQHRRNELPESITIKN